MNAMEIMLKAIGFDPEVFAETQRVFIGIAEAAQRMEAQLTRIEHNTLTIIEMSGDTAPAAPTDYTALDRPFGPLPRMPHEAEAPPRLTLEEVNERSAAD